MNPHTPTTVPTMVETSVAGPRLSPLDDDVADGVDVAVGLVEDVKT